jgi:hypothetical protein
VPSSGRSSPSFAGATRASRGAGTAIGVAVVSATASNAMSVLTDCERLVAARPEIQLLSARQRLFNEEE